MRNNISSLEQINTALDKISDKGERFLPSPGEFIEACKQSHKFLPWERAYEYAYELMRGDIPRDLTPTQVTLVRHAINASGTFFLKNCSKEQTEPVFKRNYEIAIKQLESGELLPIPKALTGKVDHTKAYEAYVAHRKAEKRQYFTFEQWDDSGRPLN